MTLPNRWIAPPAGETLPLARPGPPASAPPQTAAELVLMIEARRRALGLSWRDLGYLSKRDHKTLAHWLARPAKWGPRLAAFLDLAQALGGKITIEWDERK